MIAWNAARALAAAAAGHPPFGGIDFAVVDVETTGWSPDGARITEIGAVRVSEGQMRERFSSLVNPGTAIPPQIAALTGINDAMVEDAPPIAAVLPSFLAFADGCVLAAHNAPFDVGFLAAACRACGLRWPDFPVLDTVELARRVLGAEEVPNRKLATLAVFFGARTLPSHRALADALATADVLVGLLRRLAAAGAGTLLGDQRRGGRYATAVGWGISAVGGSSDHRDRSGEGRGGTYPGDRGGHRADSTGQ